MTDAGTPVTERVLERFVETYLLSLDAEIHKEGQRWTVSIPETAEDSLDMDGATLEIASDPTDIDDDVLAVAPESEFVERLFTETATRTPLGSLALTSEEFDIRLPSWITAGPVEVVEQSFAPYYDRRALCALFHIGIETVSEYQTEELRAVAIDLNDHEERPELAETYLEVMDTDEDRQLSGGTPLDEQRLANSLTAAKKCVESEIEGTVRDIREQATRAAEVELDDYRQFVRQRHDELEAEIEQLTKRIEDVTATTEAVSERSDRVTALRNRKRLRAERDDLRGDLDALATQIETEFPEKRREIRGRHALTVRIRPVVATSVSYERGDLGLTLRTDRESATLSFAYAVGVGVLGEEFCEQCGQRLTPENPLTLNDGLSFGTLCCGG
jgi:hypothetical protein